MKTFAYLVAAGMVLAVPRPGDAAPGSKARLTLTPGDREPAGAQGRVSDADLARLREAVHQTPKDREARFALVRGLSRAGKLDDALAAARAWRAIDAYNLVVVRLIGDLHGELGHRDQARRAYSAVVELLPKDASAQRALASVLKQAGDLDGAYQRLRDAATLSPGDRRLGFELADIAYRLGRIAEARERFEALVADKGTTEEVRYPAKQRLAQIYHQRARDADERGDRTTAGEMAKAIGALALAGGTQNDIKVYLTWDTDRSDVDLWVTNPVGEKVYYEHKEGQFGEALYGDVTTGYGPESFTAPSARAGAYLVQVNYYGVGRSNFSEARGEVVVVLNEGKPDEEKHVLPYRLFSRGQTVTVARIDAVTGGSR